MYGSDAIAGVMIHRTGRLCRELMQAKVGGEYQSNNGLYNYHAGFAGNIDGWMWNVHCADKAAGGAKRYALEQGMCAGSWFKERAVQAMVGVEKRWGRS